MCVRERERAREGEGEIGEGERKRGRDGGKAGGREEGRERMYNLVVEKGRVAAKTTCLLSDGCSSNV